MSLHTLLLVDPSPKTQAEIRAMFADEPIAVEVAEDGQQALEQIEARRPNVVLACAKAAAVDGYAIAHFVARRPNLRSVTVLLLLARSAVDERRIRESGAKGFLTKPLRAAVVVARVREALVHSPAMRSKAAAAPKGAAGPKVAARSKATTPPNVDAPASGELDAAFDAIDTNMEAPPRAGAEDAFLITPEALAKIVHEAVAKAIESHERTRSLAPAPRQDTTGGGPAQDARNQTGHDAAQHPRDLGPIKRLQREMGLDDLNLDEALPSHENAGAKPAPIVPLGNQGEDLHRLQLEMGLDDLGLPDSPLSVPFDGPSAKPRLADVALEDATAAAFGQDRPDESIEWLQEELHIPGEPDEDDGQVNGWAEAGHREVVDPFRQAVEAVRARLSTLMRHKVSHPVPDRPAPAASSPHEQAPEPANSTIPAGRPAAPKEPDDIRFTFDPLPPLPPSLLRDSDKE